MAEEQGKGIQQIEGCEVIYDMGSGLVIAKVPLDKVKEQDINARIMKNEMQDQLTANIKKRGQLESLPLFVLVDGKLEIISGHHSLPRRYTSVSYTHLRRSSLLLMCPDSHAAR